MKEEKILRQRLGSESGFSVPEKYFSTFNDRLMAQLPEGETRSVKLSTWNRFCIGVSTSSAVRKWSVAACIAVVVGFSTWRAIDYRTQHAITPTAHEIPTMAHHQATIGGQASGTDTFDEAVDYIMYDNQDIYASLMSERD